MNRITAPLFAALTVSLPALLDSAAKGTVFLAVVGFLVLFMHKTSAAARHLAWLLGIVGLLLIPLCSVALPSWRILPAWASMSPSENAQLKTTDVEAVLPNEAPRRLSPTTVSTHTVTPPSIIDVSASTPLVSSRHSPPATVTPDTTSVQWLGAAWLAGATFLLLRIATAAWLLRSSVRNAALVTNGSLRQSLDAACGDLGIRRHVDLFLDERRIVPLVWGVFRPRLVLPAEAGDWDGSRLRAVFLHELAHIKRGDLPVMLSTHIACALHWFNPLVWLAAWRMHLEREHACDDLVLTAGVKASDYAEHLLHVATRLDTASPAGALAMARPSRLEGRLLAVLDQKLQRGGVSRSVTLTTLALGIGIIIPMAMLRAQEDTVERDQPRETETTEAVPNHTADTSPIERKASSDAQPSDAKAAPEDKEKLPILRDIPLLDKLFQPGAQPEVLTLKEDGSALWNTTAVSRKELSEKLHALAKVNANRPIVLRADAKVPYKDLTQVLDVCRAAGLQNVAFAVASKPRPPFDQLMTDLMQRRNGEPASPNPENYEKLLGELEAVVRDAKTRSPETAAAYDQKLKQIHQELQELAEQRRKEVIRNQDAQQAIQRAMAEEAGLLASGLGNEHPKVKAARAQIAAHKKATAEKQSSDKIDHARELARVRLSQAESELARVTELANQKLVSAEELERAKAELEVRRAEFAGDASAVASVRLRRAEQELQRAAELHKMKMLSAAELDRAKFEVELRKAELSGDASAAARAKLQNAEAQLKRVAELRDKNLVSESEYDARRNELEIAQAELKQATASPPKKNASAASAEILQLLDDDLRLAEMKLAIMRQEEAVGLATALPALRMQAELIGLRRAKAAHEGKRTEVERLFDEQIKSLEELHRAVSGSEGNGDRQKTAIDIQREILALKREKVGTSLGAPGTDRRGM